MLESLLGGILGNGTEGKDGKKETSLGSILIIGAVLFFLLGGTKLLKPREEELPPLGPCDDDCCN